jgi:hypothetical protein
MLDESQFVRKHKDVIEGILCCFDRVIVRGILPFFCSPRAMCNYLFSQKIRIFDYKRFVQTLRDQIRENAEKLASENNLTIEYIRKKNFRKEARIREILKERGSHPGLVHIFSGLEACITYQPFHDKDSGKNYIRWDSGKCLHYYFYFIDPKLGLCFLRVPTFCPFRLEFYFNGHNLLAYRLQQKGVANEKLENAFLHVADYSAANKLASEINIRKLHEKLDRISESFCPFLKKLNMNYHWSLMQVEYSTDIIFRQSRDLQMIYPELLETLIHSVKPENIATFLGKKELSPLFKGEVTSSLQRRPLGTRIKYQMGPISIKMYDKFQKILRIEITVNDVYYFKVYRKVQSRDGQTKYKWTKMKKSIYSLFPLQNVLSAANQRYIQFLGEIQTHEIGLKALEKITTSQQENQHRYRGFSLLSAEDAFLWKTLLKGELMITGFSNSALRNFLPLKPSQTTRLLKRLRVHGLIKKVGFRYKYYLTHLGLRLATTLLKIRELVLIPELTAYRLTR